MMLRKTCNPTAIMRIISMVDNFQKNIDFRIDRPNAEFQNICNTPSKVTEFSEYLFAISIKNYSKEMTLYGIILNGSKLGTDDGSGYTAREKDIGFVSKPNRLKKKHISS